jgi:hypothetical protein
MCLFGKTKYVGSSHCFDLRRVHSVAGECSGSVVFEESAVSCAVRMDHKLQPWSGVSRDRAVCKCLSSLQVSTLTVT